MSHERTPSDAHSMERYLEAHGVDRREFLRFCAGIAAALGLPAPFGRKVAAAIGRDDRPAVIWLHLQECTGDTESLLRASRPTVAELVLDYLSVDYHETIMAAAGHQAEEARRKTLEEYRGRYIAVVEGAVPTADGGVYGCIGGRSMVEIAREVCGSAAVTICVGSCSAFGGIQAAAPNPTGARGITDLVPEATVVNLPGCPVNTSNLTATIAHILTFGSPPRLDRFKRPLFAYGKRIHDNCERRGHFDAGQFVEAWGDEGHRKGWCLYKMGCKGPESFHNCPTVRWNDGLAWPVGSGHPCVGCSEPGFWDSMSPFYGRLPGVPGVGVEVTATKVGLGLTAATAGTLAVHALMKTAQLKAKNGGREDEGNG